MGLLGKPSGIFDLNDSDKCVGSFFSKSDIKEILRVNDNDLSEARFILKDNIEVVDEREIQKLWYNNKIPNSPPWKIGNIRISLDELVLIAIIKKTYPAATIQHQIPWGRKKLDLSVTLNKETKIIEFHGPGHFTNIGYGIPPNPMDRKNSAEADFKNEYVIWPYWMQRCSLNVKAIFDKNFQNRT